MILSNITDFNKTDDYLPILNGLIIIDIIVVYLILNNILYSNLVRRWYETYKFMACFIDITTFFISLILGSFSIFKTCMAMGKKSFIALIKSVATMLS